MDDRRFSFYIVHKIIHQELRCPIFDYVSGLPELNAIIDKMNECDWMIVIFVSLFFQHHQRTSLARQEKRWRSFCQGSSTTPGTETVAATLGNQQKRPDARKPLENSFLNQTVIDSVYFLLFNKNIFLNWIPFLSTNRKTRRKNSRRPYSSIPVY